MLTLNSKSVDGRSNERSIGRHFGVWARCAFALLVAVTLSAHHSHSSLDRNNIQAHRGTVTKYDWRMPHVFIKAMAPNPAGEVVEYSIELLHPPAMMERGWGKDSLKVGDQITWEGAADKDPDRAFSGLNWLEKSDGTRLAMAKRDEVLDPSTDLTGLWVRDLRGGKAHYYPPSDWPYTKMAQALVDNFDESQNPQVSCQNPGPPKATLLPYPMKISRPDDKTVFLDYELRDAPRTIYLDRNLPAGKPSSLGHSVGWFEGDTLVVETTNFVADRWGIHTGVDSSDQKHLLERYSLSDDGLALEIQMIVTDPVYLTEPVTIDYFMAKLSDRELVDVECTLENARLYLEAGLSPKQ
ncbi:MAG: DUF6152 family protein [Proteobacteria bacterium]|nr:DUF6152 family protein [Pseudomonadota bacterium]